MIEIIQDLPPYVAAFKVTGAVTGEDYENILIPKVNQVAKDYKKINFLLWLNTDVGNYTIGAWIDDIAVGIKHFTHWHRMAIVSDQSMVKKFTDIFGYLIPGETKGYKSEDLPAALKWIAEQ
jgi:hypothetical protein